MSKTNLQCLTTVLGWSDGSLDGCENKPLSVPLPAVLQAMQAAREDEREQIREVIIRQIDECRYLYDSYGTVLFTELLEKIK